MSHFYLIMQSVLLVKCLPIVLTLFSVVFVSGIDYDPSLESGEQDGEFVGEPLFITPYLERGDILTAQRLAQVPFTDDLNIKSYAGFLTVNKSHGSNQFFWYFPSITARPDAPILIWLQGGPGASSLYGLFSETGPLMVHNNKFDYRTHNWALNHHMIYIDNPVGTGFSFTKTLAGYCVNEIQIGEQLYSTVTQFFTLFPALQQNKLFVAGESYGGKYAPALAHTIHKKNSLAKIKLNLQGIAIGNGFIDPPNLLEYSKYLYHIGLIDWNEAKVFEEYETKVRNHIKKKQWDEAFNTFASLMHFDIMNITSVMYKTTGFDYFLNFLHTNDYMEDFSPMLKKRFVRRGIHVGGLLFHSNIDVERHMKQDFMQSVVPWLSELLDHYPVMIYNGQLDIIVAYPLTVNFLRKLNFSGAEEYKTAKRHIWRVDGEIAGYVKQAGRLTEVLVRNAGHMVPMDQPKWALDLITRFTYNKNFLGP